MFAPSFELPQTDDGSVPVVEVPEVDLESGSGNTFAMSYDVFSEEGVYQVVFYAMDNEGKTAMPKWVWIGEKKVYLPLILR